MATIRQRAIRLYRAAMRSAARCPLPQHAADARSMVRLKFADGRLRGTNAEETLYAGEEELAQLEYFHAVREAKADPTAPAPNFSEVLANVRRAVSGDQGLLRAAGHLHLIDQVHSTSRHDTAGSNSRHNTAGPLRVGSDTSVLNLCPSCGTSFTPGAKFCSECGARRK
jgi:hypothetical protein